MVEPDSCFNEKLPNTPYTIKGYSRSGVGTIVQVPELGWAFDCGMVPDTSQVKEIFITHNHIDHVLCGPLIVAFARAGAHVHFHMPRQMAGPFREYFYSVAELAFFGKPPEEKRKFLSLVLIHELSSDKREEFYIDRTHFARTFKTFHTESSVGYAIYEMNSSGSFEPLLIYTGDAKGDWIRSNVEEAASFKVIITECSFLEPHPNVEKYNHTCWDNLEPYVRMWQSTTFVLIHTSLRYDHHKRNKGCMSLEVFKESIPYKNVLIPMRT